MTRPLRTTASSVPIRHATGVTSALPVRITSPVSGNGDRGADPNKRVAITDVLANTKPTVAAAESFVIVRTAGFGDVLRGVSFAPASGVNP